MNQADLTVIENKRLTGNVYCMRLKGDVSRIKAPGQFVNIKIEGLFLRRPISVCDINGNVLTIIYKVVGQGTRAMSQMKEGKVLDVLTGLGNGYETGDIAGDAPLLIGGGAGVPPLYYLAKKLLREGRKVRVILGFNTKDEIFYEEEFRNIGCDVTVTTVDGSFGTKGFVTDAWPAGISYAYACGPEPMLKAVYKKLEGSETGAQLSFEERMGCGFGACMGCSCRTITGYKRICKDGPVMRREELVW